MKYYENIVMKRNSCRGFSDKKVDDDVLVAIREYYEDEESDLVDEIETELKFYFGNVYEALSKSVGYNGVCIKAPAYMLLLSDEADHFLENAGYIAQGITLKMTELGLSACWMTINDAAATKAALEIETDKVLACVVAFGYRAEDNDEKKAPKISLDELCLGKTFKEEVDTDLFYPELEDCLRACAHAQSFQNLQPYRMLVDNDMVFLVGLPSEMTNDYDTHLNYGIVMFNFYAVMWAVRPSAPKWSFEVPDRDLKLPDDVTYVAKCRI
ncbi:MAG: nitroreductase family protein [Mogibacterium sp.]|nr:nitroreductase family protein [Mogibacterium sp.]